MIGGDEYGVATRCVQNCMSSQKALPHRDYHKRSRVHGSPSSGKTRMVESLPDNLQDSGFERYGVVSNVRGMWGHLLPHRAALTHKSIGAAKFGNADSVAAYQSGCCSYERLLRFSQRLEAGRHPCRPGWFVKGRQNRIALMSARKRCNRSAKSVMLWHRRALHGTDDLQSVVGFLGGSAFFPMNEIASLHLVTRSAMEAPHYSEIP